MNKITCMFASNNLKRITKSKKLWTAQIYGRYLYYCNLIGAKPISRIALYKQIEELGFKRSKDKLYFIGVELKVAPTENTITDMEKWSGNCT